MEPAPSTGLPTEDSTSSEVLPDETARDSDGEEVEAGPRIYYTESYARESVLPAIPPEYPAPHPETPPSDPFHVQPPSDVFREFGSVPPLGLPPYDFPAAHHPLVQDAVHQSSLPPAIVPPSPPHDSRSHQAPYPPHHHAQQRNSHDRYSPHRRQPRHRQPHHRRGGGQGRYRHPNRDDQFRRRRGSWRGSGNRRFRGRPRRRHPLADQVALPIMPLEEFRALESSDKKLDVLYRALDSVLSELDSLKQNVRSVNEKVGINFKPAICCGLQSFIRCQKDPTWVTSPRVVGSSATGHKVGGQPRYGPLRPYVLSARRYGPTASRLFFQPGTVEPPVQYQDILSRLGFVHTWSGIQSAGEILGFDSPEIHYGLISVARLPSTKRKSPQPQRRGKKGRRTGGGGGGGSARAEDDVFVSHIVKVLTCEFEPVNTDVRNIDLSVETRQKNFVRKLCQLERQVCHVKRPHLLRGVYIVTLSKYFDIQMDHFFQHNMGAFPQLAALFKREVLRVSSYDFLLETMPVIED